MKKVSILWAFIMNACVFGIVFGIGYWSQCSSEKDHNEAMAEYRMDKAEGKERLRFYNVAAGLQEGPETSYYALIRELLTKPAIKETFKENSPVQMIKLVENLRQTNASVKGLLYDEKQPEQALLAKLVSHDAHSTVFARADEGHLDDVLAGKLDVFKSLETPYDLKPEPFRFWSPLWWMVAWMIGGAIYLGLLALAYMHLAYRDDRRNVFTQYPWTRIDGIGLALTAAPAYVVVGIGYLGYRAVTLDWGPAFRKSWEFTVRNAYRFRLIRKLPPPETEYAALADPGELTDVPTTTEHEEPEEIRTRPVVRRAARERPEGAGWFVFKKDLLRGHHHDLAEAGIKPVKLAINRPRSLQGIAVPASQIDALEQVLLLEESPVSYEETDIRSVYLSTYSRESGTVTVKCRPEHEDRVTRMLHDISACNGGIDIIFDATQSLVHDPPLLGTGVVVYHCTRPSGRMKKHHAINVFGRAYKPPGNQLISPVEDCGVIIYDKHDNAVAQVVGRNIFTLVYNMLGANAEWADEALAEVISRGIEMILDEEDAATEEALKDQDWRDEIDEHRRDYIRMSMDKFRHEKLQLKRDIKACNTEVTEQRKAIATSLRDEKNLKKRLDRLENGPLRLKEEELGNEFDQLMASRYVSSVKSGKGYIDVFTVPIFIDHEGRRYEIGRFRLRLSDNGEIGIANIANTALTTAWDHPHISPQHGPCFGNLNESLAKYLGKRQFAAAVSLLYRFLEQYNPHRGVQDIRKWKEVKRERDTETQVA